MADHHPACAPDACASAPSRDTRAQGTRPQKRHTSRLRRDHKLGRAKEAAKEAAKRAQINRKLVEPCAVYVGNVGSDVDEKTLENYFKACGKILSVKIHCCGGVALSTKPPPESGSERAKVRQYAVVVFESQSARERACKLDKPLAGRPVTVSTAISDLPEVREKITKRLDDYRARMEPPDARRAQKSALKSLGLEPTVLLDVEHGKRRRARRRRNGFFEHSILQTIV